MLHQRIALLLIALVSAPAGAVGLDQLDTGIFSVSGFGTLGVVRTDSDQAQFVRDRQYEGADRSPSLIVDSNIGLQLGTRPVKGLSATVQLLGMQREEKNFKLDFEWAYLKVEPISGLFLRAGRMALPMFANSDSRNVGYSNTWLRPPDEVYGLSLLHRLEGADLTYRRPVANGSLSASLLAGRSFIDVRNRFTVDVKNVRGVSVQYERDWFTVRVGHVRADVPVELLVDRYAFTGIGVSLDRHNVVAQAEYVTRKSRLLADFVGAEGGYILGGYRFNTLLPYVRYGRTLPENPSGPLHFTSEQSTVALGLRWDAFRSAAIKFQLERADTHDSPGISFVTPSVAAIVSGPPQSALPLTRPILIGSLAIDFVF